MSTIATERLGAASDGELPFALEMLKLDSQALRVGRQAGTSVGAPLPPFNGIGGNIELLAPIARWMLDIRGVGHIARTEPNEAVAGRSLALSWKGPRHFLEREAGMAVTQLGALSCGHPRRRRQACSGAELQQLAAKARSIALSVPHFTTAAMCVIGTSYIATLPDMMARRLADFLPLTTCEPPFAVPPHHNPASVAFSDGRRPRFASASKPYSRFGVITTSEAVPIACSRQLHTLAFDELPGDQRAVQARQAGDGPWPPGGGAISASKEAPAAIAPPRGPR